MEDTGKRSSIDKSAGSGNVGKPHNERCLSKRATCFICGIAIAGIGIAAGFGINNNNKTQQEHYLIEDLAIRVNITASGSDHWYSNREVRDLLERLGVIGTYDRDVQPSFEITADNRIYLTIGENQRYRLQKSALEDYFAAEK